MNHYFNSIITQVSGTQKREQKKEKKTRHNPPNQQDKPLTFSKIVFLAQIRALYRCNARKGISIVPFEGEQVLCKKAKESFS